MWVGTDQVVIRLKEGSVTTTRSGKNVVKGASNKHFHDKNGMISNHVLQVIPQMKDVWFLTDKGINRYNKAERQASIFYEQLLPKFGLNDLYHMYSSLTWPTEDWGTMAFFVKYISFGDNVWTDELGRELGIFRAFDAFGGFSYGTALLPDVSIGLNIKFIYSQLSPSFVHVGAELGAGIAISYEADVGMLARDMLPRTTLGLNFQNMGPAIFYIDKDQEDPIPFNIRLGAAVKVVDNPVHKLTWITEFNREMIRRDPKTETPDPWFKAIFTSWVPQKEYKENFTYKIQEIIPSTGFEYWYSNFFAARIGTMYDKLGCRGELTFGFGLNINNLMLDFSSIAGSTLVDDMLGKLHIVKPWTQNDEGSARHGEKQFSIIFVF